MRNKRTNSVIFLTVMLFSLIAKAGFDRGNGTDYVRFEDQGAWYFSPGRQISYCIEMAPNFGVSRGSAQGAIEKAFQVWGDYFRKHGFINGIVFQGALQPSCTK